MKFLCNTDCYSSKLCKGFRAGLVYDLNAEEMDAMGPRDGKPGHFPRRFDPADTEAQAFLLKLSKPEEPPAADPESNGDENSEAKEAEEPVKPTKKSKAEA